MADQGAISASVGGSEPSTKGPEWPTQAADTVVRIVDSVREKTTDRAVLVARAVVYGLLAAILGGAAAVLGAILTVRLLDAYLPDAVFGERHTWAAHALIGAFFVLVGGLLWSRRHGDSS